MSKDINLSKIDYDILKFVSRHQPVHVDKIKKHLPKWRTSIDLRISQLENPDFEYSNRSRYPLPNSSHIREIGESSVGANGFYSFEGSGFYELSEFGYQSLQDYRVLRKTKRRELWTKNMWIPILVSIAINVIIRAIESLWQPILRWLANIP